MPRLNAANRARTKLDETIDDAATSFAVVDPSQFPPPPFLVSIEDEIIEVGAVDNGEFVDVLRGQEGTVAEMHEKGVSVENRLTAGMYNVLSTIEDLDTGKSYKYFLRIQDGGLQFVTEEVEEVE